MNTCSNQVYTTTVYTKGMACNWQKPADGRVMGMNWQKTADGRVMGMNWQKTADGRAMGMGEQ